MKQLLEKIKEALVSALPVTAIVYILALTPLFDLSRVELITFTAGAVLLVLGIGLFSLGADLAMTPMGTHVGSGLSRQKKLGLLLSVCFVLGMLITIAEPDLQVLANQVSAVMDGTVLIYAVGLGVGAFLVVAILKIVFRRSLSQILMLFYMLLFALALMLVVSGNEALLPWALTPAVSPPARLPYLSSWRWAWVFPAFWVTDEARTAVSVWCPCAASARFWRCWYWASSPGTICVIRFRIIPFRTIF